LRAHGAHLVYQVEGMKQSFTVLTAPPPFVSPVLTQPIAPAFAFVRPRPMVPA